MQIIHVCSIHFITMVAYAIIDPLKNQFMADFTMNILQLRLFQVKVIIRIQKRFFACFHNAIKAYQEDRLKATIAPSILFQVE